MTRNLANNVGSSGFLPSRIIAHEKLSQLLTPKGSFEDAHVTQQKKPPKVTFNDYVNTILPFLTTYLLIYHQSPYFTSSTSFPNATLTSCPLFSLTFGWVQQQSNSKPTQK